MPSTRAQANAHVQDETLKKQRTGAGQILTFPDLVHENHGEHTCMRDKSVAMPLSLRHCGQTEQQQQCFAMITAQNIPACPLNEGLTNSGA
jgi:hypothetical protein